LALISVVGTGLVLSLDVEPCGPRDSEYAAGQRLLRRTLRQLGLRFADDVEADAEYARAGFLHLAGDMGLRVVARLKANLPELFQAVQRHFRTQPPTKVFNEGSDHVEVCDADNFDPWDTLRWERLYRLRYLHRGLHRPRQAVALVRLLWLGLSSPRALDSS
jgi:hypothetical protein